MKLRPALVQAHRWFGLLGAVWLFLLGITGSLLVFYYELDHALNPELFRPTAQANRIGFDQAVQAVEAAGPGRQVLTIYGFAPGDIWTAVLAPGPGGKSLEVYVDPATGEVRGERFWEALQLDRAHLMPLTYRLHYSLLGGEPLTWFLGLVGFIWLLDHVIAAVLAFPAPKRWMESFRIRARATGYKRTFDLHRAVGLWLFPLTLVVAATGTYMNWRPYADAVISPFSKKTPWPGDEQPALPEPLKAPAVSFDGAVRASGLDRPQGASLRPDKGLYVVHGFGPRDLTTEYGALAVVIDANSGRELSRRHTEHGTAADVIDAWALPLHSGKVFGWPGRIAIFLSGIALCSFVVTGLMIWNRKRRRVGRVDRPVVLSPDGTCAPSHTSLAESL